MINLIKKPSIILSVFLLALASCAPSVEAVPTGVDIYLDEEIVNSVTIFLGDELDLDAVVHPDNASQEVYWSINDTSIATIDDEGLITPHLVGTTTIKAVSNIASYVYKTSFLEVREPTYYGSGKTSSDPLFIGETDEEEPLDIYFFEMQHIYSDSLFIKKGNVEILIDAGWSYDGNYISDFLDEHVSDGRLDVLMASHNDSDHVDGLENALQNIDNISLIIDFGHLANRGKYGVIKDSYVEKGATYHPAIDCISYVNNASKRYYLTSDFYVDILDTGYYVETGANSAGNSASLTTIFTYQDFKFFTAGDLTSSAEARLLQRENLYEVTLYKASHHGSHGSNTQELMNALNPKGVAISAARANQYNVPPGPPSQSITYNLDGKSGHPAAAAIERIYKIPNISENLNVYWNAVNGTMRFRSYGTDDFTFSGTETIKGYYDLSKTDGVAVWNAETNDFENKVTGEENYKLHESKVFVFRNYVQYLPLWAQEQYFPI